MRIKARSKYFYLDINRANIEIPCNNYLQTANLSLASKIIHVPFDTR